MARLRSEFYFAMEDLLVARETLGARIEFQRDGYTVQVRIPSDAKEFFPKRKNLDAIGRNWRGVAGDPHQRVNVLILQVVITGEGPVSAADCERLGDEAIGKAIEYCDRAAAVAEAVTSELVDWTRLRGQAWLGLHGERPNRLPIEQHIDEDSGDRLPTGTTREMGVIIASPPESAIDPAFVASLERLLGDDRLELPIAATLLADALHFRLADPPDAQRAVLFAAIACEVKAGEVLLADRRSRKSEKPKIVADLFDRRVKNAVGRSLLTDNAELHGRIEKLFQLRNGIAHRGEKPATVDAKDVVAAAEDLFGWLAAVTNKEPLQKSGG